MREGHRSHFGCPALENKCYGRLHSITQCERVRASMCVCVHVHVHVWQAVCVALCVCDTLCMYMSIVCVGAKKIIYVPTLTFHSKAVGAWGCSSTPRNFGAKDDSRRPSPLLYGVISVSKTDIPDASVRNFMQAFVT